MTSLDFLNGFVVGVLVALLVILLAVLAEDRPARPTYRTTRPEE